jgi:hypothetical protein
MIIDDRHNHSWINKSNPPMETSQKDTERVRY